MSAKKYLWIVSAAVLLFSGAASADIITYQFTGTVSYGGTLASTGNTITGSFSYHTKSKPVISNPGYASYRFIQPFGMSASVNGHSLSTTNLGVDVVNNFGGNVEDMVDIFGGPIQVDSDSFPDGYFGLHLASKAGNTKVLKNTKLPTSYNVNEFDAGSEQNYGTLQIDGSPNGTLLQFSIDSIVIIRIVKH